MWRSSRSSRQVPELFADEPRGRVAVGPDVQRPLDVRLVRQRRQPVRFRLRFGRAADEYQGRPEGSRQRQRRLRR